MGNKRNSQPSLKRNALSNVAVMMLGIVVTFFLTPWMLNYLGEQRYGMWMLASSLVGYFGLLQFGLTASVLRFVPHYRGAGEHERVSRVVSTSLGVYLGIGVLAVALVVPLSLPIAHFFSGGPELAGLITAVALGFALNLPSLILNTAVKGYEGFAFVNIVSVVSLLMRFALLTGCMKLGLGLVAMGTSLVLIEIVNFTGQWIAFHRVCHGVKLKREYFSREELKTLFVFGGVVMLASAANALAVEAPKQIVGKLLSLDSLGLFAIPVMILGYVRQLVFTLTRVLAPRISLFSAQGKHDEVSDLFFSSSRLIAIFSTGIFVMLWVCGPAFLKLWTKKPNIEEMAPGLLWLAAGNAILLSHRVSTDVLLAIGRVKLMAMFEAAEAGGILVLTVILLKFFGVTGAAAGLAIPFILARGVAQPVAICRVLGLSWSQYHRRCIVGPWAIGVVIAVGSLALRVWDHQGGWVQLFVSGALTASCYLTLVGVFVCTPAEREASVAWFRRRIGWSAAPAA